MAEPIVTLNILISLICLWAGFFLNYRFLQPALVNSNRFRLFELRDDLRLLVMRGKLAEESEAYSILNDMIEMSLHSTQNFKLTTFVGDQVRLFNSNDLRSQVIEILEKIESKDLPAEYQAIVSEFYHINYKLFLDRTKILLYGLFCAYWMLKITSHVFTGVEKSLKWVGAKRKDIKAVKRDLDEGCHSLDAVAY